MIRAHLAVTPRWSAALTGWCAALALLAASAGAHAQVAFEWGQVSPFAVFAEEITSSTITVRAKLSNPPPQVVARYFGNWFSGGTEPLRTLQLQDNGLNGDAAAGDGIYSGQFVFSGGLRPLRRYGGQLDHLPIVIQALDGAGTVIPFANVADSQLELGLVARSNRVPAVQLSSQIRTADAAVNIVDPSYFADLSERRVMQAFYSAFPDSVDGFAIFSGGRTVGDGAARAFAVKNSVSGIGLPVFDTSAEYGSQGKLKYAVRANNDINGENFLHEFAHSFGIHLNKPALDLTTNGTEGIHWGPSDILGKMGGAPYLRNNNNGTFTLKTPDPATASTAHLPYADIELYLMGLMPAAQVAPHRFVLSSPAPAMGATINAAQTQLVSIANIEQVYGSRFPTAAASQRNFAFAFIVVSESFVQPAELALVNTLARYYARPSGGGTLVGGGKVFAPDPPTFAAATGNRGTLTTALYRYEHDRLFDWAQSKYPEIFGPSAQTQDVAGYQARVYANGIYLGTANGRVYVYGPPWGGLRDMGSVADYLPLAIQDGY